MKTIFRSATLAIAALAMGLTSCNNDTDAVSNNDPKQLSIKIAGVVKSDTRAVQAPGQTAVGTITLTDGYIFVLSPMGVVTYKEALNVSTATSPAGQQLLAPVAGDSRVYIVGNIPAADLAQFTGLVDGTATLSDIQSLTSLITTQIDYTEAALGNVGGTPVQITTAAGATTATVSVSITPVISRIELTQVKAKGTGAITEFTVKAVRLDSYYPSFTYGGGHSGAKYDINASGPGVGDTGSWIAAGTGTSRVAIPTTGGTDVWAHNVASGGLPRFIIELDDIKYETTVSGIGGTVEVALPGVHYLTVTGYNGGALTSFEPGKIYRIGGAAGIEFDQDDLGLTPNPVDVDLTVDVAIVEWDLVTPSADL